MRALRQKTHISHRMVAYSIYDPALLEVNDEEVVKEYEKTRNIDVLKVTKDMIKFTLAPISAVLYEGIINHAKLDARVLHMREGRSQIIKKVEEESGLSMDKWTNKEWLTHNFIVGNLEDSYTQIEKNLWKSFLDLPRRMQEMWLKAGVAEISCDGEKYTVEQFQDNMDPTLYPLMREEMADIIRSLSELGPDLGK